VFDMMTIQSQSGPYTVAFEDTLLDDAGALLAGEPHFLIDANVARIYADRLRPLLDHSRTILIEATEDNKSLERLIPVFERLVANRMRRDHTLVAIGGGVIQDITCFVATTLLRGVEWQFVPTTLLAQADSCIGSKSSINLGAAKNILGTFKPPRRIRLCTGFLDTLEVRDVLSGIGEILKVHAIAGAAAFDRVSADYERMLGDRHVLLSYIRDALRIKQGYIEQDEFDRGIRNIFNYGHSFGHAIESATQFAVPHGVAVTMGMDMANRIASMRGLLPEAHFHRMHGVLGKNYRLFGTERIRVDDLLEALMKDKKNTATRLGLVFPVGDDARIERVNVEPDAEFSRQCARCLEEMRG
jgi:3-dehydroquinate synthase